jgi:tetratricopeptide (TPR) repeat protein/transglutaminase-like putative cysteine protease
MLLWAGAALCAQSANAADALKFGAAPAWVHPRPIPAPKPSDAPLSLLLSDEQVRLERGKITAYAETAIKFLNAQGLNGANVVALWQPATDTITINKLQIRRGDKVIDVLAGGQTFTVLRRETNLEAATLDGTLTATLQPEGLQVGDIVDFAYTLERSDPVMKGHTEAMFGAWDGLPVRAAHATVSWPADLHMELRQTPNLPAAQKSSAGGLASVELTASDVQPLVPPKGAPARFKIGRLAEATDFTSWSDIATLFAPLYRQASAIAATGLLHDEVEKIRAASSNPKTRAEQALALVQDRVRYVALLMGEGGYVPAPAETTWSRRFGDCKGKTALLLAILHSLGIEAEPALAQVGAGDIVADRMPMVALFNHVLVRAHIGGKEYWLDGTRSGDTDLDAIETPDLGWGLPLVANTKLVHMVPAALAAPKTERHIDVDATGGIYAPAAVTVEEIHRGDTAVDLNTTYSALTAEQRNEAIHSNAKSYFDTFQVDSSSEQFDKAKRELRMTMKGSAKLDWKDGWFSVPRSSLAFDPDFDRPAGPLHDAPWELNHPSFVRDEVVIRLPAGVAAQQKLHAPVHETLEGVEYVRTEAVDGNALRVVSSERTVVPEVPYKEALAAAPRLKALDKDDVYLRVTDDYRATAKDVAELKTQQPSSATDYFLRAAAYLAHNEVDEALSDLNAGLAFDPKNVWAFTKRAWIRAGRHEFADAEKDVAALEALEPGTVETIGTRAYVAEIKGDYAVATQEYSKLLERDSRSKFARTRRGLSYAAEGKTAEAIQDLTALVVADPKDFGSLLNRAEVEANASDFANASKDVEAARILQPNNSAVLSSAGRLAERQGDYRLAVKFYSQQIAAQEASPYSPTLGETPLLGIGGAFAARAAAYRSLGEYQNAIADTDAALKAGYKDPSVRLLRANILLGQGKHDAVGREADLMLQEAGNSSWALVGAAKTYAVVGQREKAMKTFDRALAIKPEAYIYVNRAQVRLATDITGQLADADEALKLEPAMPEAILLKVDILTRAGRFGEALALYDRLPKTAADEFWAQFGRAALLAKTGKTAEADKTFAALHSRAKSPNELNSLCWAEGTNGVALEEAIRECGEAVKSSNRNPQYVDSLGMALLKSGKLDEALAAYSEAIEKAHLPASYMGRAIVYARRGDLARAQADSEQAKKLDSQIEDRFADYGLKLEKNGSGPGGAQKSK